LVFPTRELGIKIIPAVAEKTLHEWVGLSWDRNALAEYSFLSIPSFIESEGVPPDGKVVDQTWRYMNKKDGPDRRFKDNRELRIALYEELQFTSASALSFAHRVSYLRWPHPVEVASGPCPGP
jgi:hypothetical protein